MKSKIHYLATIMAVAALTLAACDSGGQPLVAHELVATGNDHSVPMYPDEQTYLKVSHMEQQGGVEGLAGDVRKTFSAKTIDDQTPVTIVSTDDNGAVVAIDQGPMKGQTGFVARQNID